MNSQHKTKATIGTSWWFATIPLAIGLGLLFRQLFPAKDQSHVSIAGWLCLLALASQYFAFFWGGSHPAKAKE